MSGQSSEASPLATERERWELVQRIFLAAVDLGDESRDGFVRRACEGDSALEAEVNALLEADLAAVDYMEAPLVGAAGLATLFDAPLAPGDLLCERFEIVRSIAEGGMGHVFEALDRELHVRVALKVIRPEIASVPEALARFRREVRLARTITHPNVCRTFDIDRDVRTFADGREHEVVFLTMELLAGETLAAKIAREGPLKLADALELAKQMASALEAAHALGVVHRDIKPANVMLVPVAASDATALRAVITDFGLARLDPVLEAGASLSPASLGKSGQPVGTFAYMAPEQLEGRPVSPATDVYALGLILFEMVTGRRAFPSGNVLSGLTERLTGAPPSAKAFAAALPPRWSYAIERCLCVKASDRFQSAGEAVGVLEGRRGRLGMARQRARGAAKAALRTRRSRWIASGAAVVAIVSLFAGGVRLYVRTANSEAAEKVAAGALVYLAPVANETGDARLDNVTELLEAGLAQSAQVNLLDRGKVGDILQQMTKPPDTKIDQPTAREIAMRAGAVRVVFATLTGGKSSSSNGSYTLQMEVQQPDNTPRLFRKHTTRTFTWTSSGASTNLIAIAPELSGAVRDASDWVRHEVGESAGDIARLDVPPEDVTTSSWEALAEYTRAEALQSEGKNDEAVSALKTSVQKDPAFALAYARLGDILVSRDDASGYDFYLKALEQQDQHSLSLRERDRIQGIYASDTHDFQTAEKSFREYASFYPHDYLPWFYRGYPLMMLGRGRDAVRMLAQAHEADPNRMGALLEMCLNDMVLGDLEAAQQCADELRSRNFPDAAQYAASLVPYAEGKINEAIQQMNPLRGQGKQGMRVGYSRWIADARAERGRYREAVEVLNEALVTEPGNEWLLLDRADLLGRLGDLDGCLNDVERATRAATRVDTLMDSSRVLGRAATFGSSTNRQRVSKALQELESRLPRAHYGLLSDLARERLRGEILLAGGDASGAIKIFRQADKLDAPSASRDYLARALLALAARTANHTAANVLRRKAMDAYAPVALHHGPMWQWQSRYPPGFYADQLEQWVRLAHQTGEQSAADPTLLADASSRLSSLRRPSLVPGESVSANAGPRQP